MRKIKVFLIMSLILIGCMRGVAVHAGETGEIINPSFEIWETGEGLDGWTKSADTTAGAVKPAWSENDAQDGNYNLACWAESDYHVDIYQDVKGLEPGYYYLTAYAQNGGGQKSCSLYAGGSGQSYASTMIPVSEGGVTKGWRGVTVRGIEVKEDGALRIGLRTDAYAGNWMKLDNLNLVRETNQETPYEFLKGGDISELTWLEDSGAVFYDENGSPKDALQILADSGFNFARLRLYNAPGKGKGNGTYYCKEGYQDLPDILSLAKRASDKGMELELSFHYSDYWSNGETQNIPKEWQEQIEGMSEEDAVDKLCSLVYDYTYEVMKEMESQGTVPAFVSLGNEIQSGMLFPYGKASSENWKYLARFLTSGSNAVKAASPETKVIIHLDGAGDSSKYTGFFDNCESFGVPYDIIGPSYYPFWTDCDVDTIVAFCNDMVERYDKDIMIMETGYNFNPVLPNGQPGQLSDNGCYSQEGTYGSTPEGQKNFMADLFNGLKSVIDGRCLGDLYWDPVMVEQRGVGWAMLEATDEPDINVISNTTLFDFEHKLLPVGQVYRDSQAGYAEGGISGRLVKAGQNTEGVNRIEGLLRLNGIDHHIQTDAYGYFYLGNIPEGSYNIELLVDGMEYARNLESLEIEKGKNTVCSLELKGAVLSGKVLDDSGTGVENAAVYASDGTHVFETVTDAEGGYTMQDIPAGTWEIWAEAAGYDASEKTEKTLALGETLSHVDFQIILNSGSITGKVLDQEENPLADVRVSAMADDITVLTFTDENGVYTLSHLKTEKDAAKIYKLNISKAGYVEQEYEAEVLLGQSTQAENVVLKKDMGSVRGKVMDSNGMPAEGVTIAISGTDTYEAVTDENGCYSIAEMTSGTYTVQAEKEGYMKSAALTMEIVYGEQTKADVLVLPDKIEVQNPGFELPANPEDEWDKVPAGWEIEATSNEASGSSVIRQDRSTFGGAFEGQYGLSFWLDEAFAGDVSQQMSGLEPGNYLLRAYVYSGISQDFCLYAKDSSGEIIGSTTIQPSGGYSPVSLVFSLEEEVCSIGFYADTAGSDWAVADQVELGYLRQYEPSYEEPDEKPDFTAPKADVRAIPQEGGSVEAVLMGADEEKGTADWHLIASPAEGYRFVKWVDGNEEEIVISTNPDYMTVLNEDRSFAAVFVKEETPKPDDTPDPDDKPKPDDTPNSDDMPNPDDTLKPDDTSNPDDTPKPDSTPNQDDKPKPDHTSKPGAIQKPGNTAGAGNKTKPGNSSNLQNKSAKAAKTGDETQTGIYLCLMTASGIAALGVFAKKGRKKDRNKGE